MLQANSVVAQMLNADLSQNIQDINKRSTDVQLDCKPDILITETLGYLGIDEGIVEQCFDFCARHPSIKKLMPSVVRLKCQFLYLAKVVEDYDTLLNSYLSCFAYVSPKLVCEFERLFCSLIRKDFINADGLKICSEQKLIRQFELGLDKTSGMEYSIDCGQHCDANVIHFYFEADLASGITLSNYVFDPKTHWLHSYAAIPRGAFRGRLIFTPSDRKLKLIWE
jgi:hypothetical protein